ncbi:MAG: hypothetical protein J07HQW2_00646 [Haloquadratum walsbyi J07HQW2]|uniref:Uncharacterized protein n=1 Tax=Haloquadratum walsbyi J07HQW2 TaxID=1238425 RepID=U1PKK0_9EURY|nr:MAG: hypothetical protein J07HQW2_00646 [Haloquadratum walsbyi J07HQW2]
MNKIELIMRRVIILTVLMAALFGGVAFMLFGRTSTLAGVVVGVIFSLNWR